MPPIVSKTREPAPSPLARSTSPTRTPEFGTRPNERHKSEECLIHVPVGKQPWPSMERLFDNACGYRNAREKVPMSSCRRPQQSVQSCNRISLGARLGGDDDKPFTSSTGLYWLPQFPSRSDGLARSSTVFLITAQTHYLRGRSQNETLPTVTPAMEPFDAKISAGVTPCATHTCLRRATRCTDDVAMGREWDTFFSGLFKSHLVVRPNDKNLERNFTGNKRVSSRVKLSFFVAFFSSRLTSSRDFSRLASFEL